VTAVGLVGLLAAGCASNDLNAIPTNSITVLPESPSGDLATRFTVCLQAAGVDAWVQDTDTQTAPIVVLADTGNIIAPGVMIGYDSGVLFLGAGGERGNFLAVTNSSVITQNIMLQESYAACEAAFPDFVQGRPLTQSEWEATDAFQQALEHGMEDGLIFARCARDNGFYFIPDPDPRTGESEYISLHEFCWLGQDWGFGRGPRFGWSSDDINATIRFLEATDMNCLFGSCITFYADGTVTDLGVPTQFMLEQLETLREIAATQ